MKRFSQIIFTIAMVIGLAFNVPAQKDDKRPPKKPPVVNPNPDKPPRGNPPKDERPPKRPGN